MKGNTNSCQASASFIFPSPMSAGLPFNEEILIPDDTDPPLLPASFRDENHIFSIPSEDTPNFLLKDLSVKRLNRIGENLWLAGRPMPPRPLNYQLATSRQIVVDERIDMHLVWENSRRIHLKPIPRYLLCPKFWESDLVCTKSCCCVSKQSDHTVLREWKPCNRKELYKYGLGFLFSYMALIQYESDFVIAMNHHLLPKDVTWKGWFKLTQNLLRNGSVNPKNINTRYLFGELRLSRLNKIYAFCCGNSLRGYQFTYQTYAELFHEYFTPLTVITIYIALVLAAMQVGLATDHLSGSLPFQNASYGFTLFSILGPLIMVLLVAIVGCLQFANNLIVTWRFKKKQLSRYEELQGQLP